MGLTARVDLCTDEVVLSPTFQDDLDRFLGGRGLGAALLYRLVQGPLDPFAAEAPVIFTPGRLTGTSWPSSARGSFSFQSPLTGIYGYANSSGHFWAALNQAGFDAVIVTGRASAPCYLDIAPGSVRIVPAPELWGKDTAATTEALSDGGGRVACIGPAGENRVRIAGLMVDGHRAAARAGGGAAMGAKNLKALRVQADRSAANRAASRDFPKITGSMARKVRGHPESQALSKFGTPLLIRPKNMAGDLPAYNHQAGQVPWWGKIDAEAIGKFVLRHRSCHACPIGCDHITRVEEGPHATELGGPEYETVDALGPLVGMQEMPAIIHANKLCNDLGLDTISTGVCVAFAMELHQRGLLSDAQFSLEWGDEDCVLGLIEAIGRRQGLGDVLADGVRLASKRLGPETERYALHVKGMELPRQEPRIAKAFGLAHSTSNRGADHLYALPCIDIAHNWDAANALFPQEMRPKLMELSDETYKPDEVVLSEHFSAVSDALGLCKFTTTETWALMPDDVAAGYSAYIGQAVTGADLLKAGERIVNLERLYNRRLGITRDDDRLPARFTEEPLPIYSFVTDEQTGEVAASGEPVHVGLVQDLDAMLDRYYRLRGWDERGLPTPEKLAELGLCE